MIITQIMNGMQGQYSRVPMPYAYTVKSEYKQNTRMSGGVNKPLLREDSCTLRLILLQEYFSWLMKL